ncbi:MAG: hypothetical protein HY708_06495, partial [Ignavibacteriae bacterium]|nr:hypothetical protein [Ignavibacteriota bacterium]
MSADRTSPPGNSDNIDKAKRYNRIKLSVGIASSLLSFVFLVALVASGVSSSLSAWVQAIVSNEYIALLSFVLCIGIAQSIL